MRIPKQFHGKAIAMAATVKVSCTYAPGVHVFGSEYGEHYLVKGVLSSFPADVWDAWLAQHQDTELVKNGLVYEVSRD